MHRIRRTVLVVIATIVFAVAGYVLVHHDPAPTGTTPADAVATTPAGTTGPPSPASSTTRPAGLVVAFLGDDWTAGTGASKPGKRFTTIVSRRLGVAERNFGADGSGYAKSTNGSGTYADRVDAVVAAHPDVVVVTGGRNDRPDYAPTAADAARALFRTLHERLPDATLVAVAPWWGDSDLPPEMTALAHAVRSGVRAAGGTYLNVGDPIHGHPDYMADAADPDDQGYAAIATALTDPLRSVLPH